MVHSCGTLFTLLLSFAFIAETIAWEYEQSISTSLTSTAQFQGKIQVTASHTNFAQAVLHLEFNVRRWSSAKNLPACGEPPSNNGGEPLQYANAPGTCPKVGDDKWNEEYLFVVDITIESISLTNCEINKLVLHTAVYTTNQKCATHFPQNRKCSFEASANFKSGKLEDSAYSKEETSQLETMLTAENTLPDQKHSFQIDFQTLISSSLGKYLTQVTDDSSVPKYNDMFNSFGLSGTKMIITLDHFWTRGLNVANSAGASLHVQFEWGLKAMPEGTTSYLSGASGDLSIMRLLSEINNDGIDAAQVCVGWMEAPGNFCLVTSALPSGSAWGDATKCIMGEQEQDIIADGCTEQRRLRRQLINSADLPCKNNGVQYYNIHENKCTTEGQDIYSNGKATAEKKSVLLGCCKGLIQCHEPRSQKGHAAFIQKHGTEKNVPETVQVCRSSCCERNELGIGRCSGGGSVKAMKGLWETLQSFALGGGCIVVLCWWN